MKRISTILFLSACVLGSGTFAQTPFPANQYIAVTKPGNNTAAPNYKIYTSAAPISGYSAGVSISSAHDINGTGFNPNDNFVYGSAFIGAADASTDIDVAFYRIGADGTYTDLGYLPVAGADPMRFVNYNGGAVSTDNKYYYIAIGVKGSGLAKFLGGNITGITPDDLDFYIAWISGISGLNANSGNNIPLGGYYPINVSDPAVYAAMNSYIHAMLAAYPNVQKADGGIQDIAISPANTDIYGYITYPDPSTGNSVGNLIQIAPPPNGSDEVPVTVIGNKNTSPGVEMDGVTFDPNNNLYGLFVNGNFAKIDLTTGALSDITASGFALSGGNLRGDFTGYVTNNALPITLNGNINVRFEKGSNIVTWETSSEINVSGFEVQHSTDAETWSDAGFKKSLAAGGNSTVKLDYTFEDSHPAAGDNYYRLKVEDLDGHVSYPNYIAHISNSNTGDISIYPNPAADYINLSGVNEDAAISIYNSAGHAVKSESVLKSTGDKKITLKGIAPGVYRAVITTKSGVKKEIGIIIK